MSDTTQQEQVKLVRSLADRYWLELIEVEPLLGTEAGDERFDDRLPDASDAGRARAADVHRGALNAAAAFDRAALPPSERGTMDMLEAVARRGLSEIEHRLDRLYAASHFSGPVGTLGVVASLQRTDTPERLDRYETRLRSFPAHLDAWADVAREGIAAGVVSPRVVVARSIAQLERLLALDTSESPALMPLSDDDTEARERVSHVVRDVVNPALQRYLGVLRDVLPHATETVALRALPGGEELYAAQILGWTTLALDPQDVHEIGVERFESIQRERNGLAASLGYRDAATAIAVRTDSGDNIATTPGTLVEMANAQIERGMRAAPGYFGRLPVAGCEVRLVEPYHEADMAFAFYWAPSGDGDRPGIYYVNGYDLANRPLHIMASVTFHEAVPGHHFQLAIEQEMADRPALRRFAGTRAGSAFAEGWGLYSERLADEMGLYADDWERLGMLDAQIHRAARLVTDTGLHALGWTRQRAIDTLEEGGVPHSDAVIEVDRYIAEPAQALSYMIGMIEIERARAEAESSQGDDFSLREFHDRVLGLGQLPLPAFRREMGIEDDA
ncbi:hypothetical protein BH18ACT17_BH18ACT17_10360 [soil metagenome]